MSEDENATELASLVEGIGNSWKLIYDSLEEDSAPAAPYLNGLTHNEVGESILTILEWMRSLGKVKKNTPKTHRLARAALLAKARTIKNRLAKMEAGEYSGLTSLINDLSVCLSNLAATTIVSRKREEIAEKNDLGRFGSIYRRDSAGKAGH